MQIENMLNKEMTTKSWQESFKVERVWKRKKSKNRNVICQKESNKSISDTSYSTKIVSWKISPKILLCFIKLQAEK